MLLLSDNDIIQVTCAVLIDGKNKNTAWLVSEEGHPLTAHNILWGYQRDIEIDYTVFKLANLSVNRRPLSVALACSFSRRELSDFVAMDKV
jgi:hypothetical protein